MQAVEISILNFISTFHSPILDQIMIGVTILGNLGMVWILLTLVLCVSKKYRNLGKLLAFALLIDAILCIAILKPLVARIRPCDVVPGIQLLIKRPSDFSFPSGHTAFSFTAVSVLYFKRFPYWKMGLVFAVLIAFSRLYLYVHFPTDVLGGIMLGIFSGWIALKASENFDRREL